MISIFKKILKTINYSKKLNKYSYLTFYDDSSFNIKSKIQQLTEFLDNSPKQDLNFINISNEVYDKFTFEEICQVDLLIVANSVPKEVLENGYGNFVDRLTRRMKNRLEEVESNFNTVQYLGFLIKESRKLSNYTVGSYRLQAVIEDMVEQIDVYILQNNAILEEEIKENFSFEYALGYFFIYDKKIALNKFVNLIGRYESTGDFEKFIFRLHLIIDKFFLIINQDFIPKIPNYPLNSSLLMHNDNCEFITESELKKIIDPWDYFLKRNPLDALNPYEFLDKKVNFKDLNRFRKIIDSYFKEKVNNKKLYINNIPLVDIFIENITSPTPSYSIKDLAYARQTIIEIFKNRDFKYELTYFISLFYQCLNTNIISGSVRFTKILSIYLTQIKCSKSTISDIISREYISDYKMSIRESALNRVCNY